MNSHTCFGCDRQIGSHEQHIHVPMDEWAIRNGKEPLGMDDILPAFAFCLACTQRSENGWMLEAHPVWS